MPYERHCDILSCIKDTLDAAILADGRFTTPAGIPKRSFDTRIEDYSQTADPEQGIIISPERESERPGLNSSDDIVYSTLITRVTHSLDSEDKEKKLSFRALVRLLFHNKKIECAPGCLVVSFVDFGPISSEREWETRNQSTSIIRVNMLVREPREQP